MSYVSATLRRLVTQRAGEQCEYCRFPQTASLFAFEIDKDTPISKAKNLKTASRADAMPQSAIATIKVIFNYPCTL